MEDKGVRVEGKPDKKRRVDNSDFKTGSKRKSRFEVSRNHVK